MIEIPATTTLLTTHCPRIEEGMYDLNRLLAITIEGVLSTMMFSPLKKLDLSQRKSGLSNQAPDERKLIN